jgi:hypothetical protein
MRKVKRAAKILFYKRHRQPGVKGWELKRALGKDYQQILSLLNQRLASLDLQVKTVFETGEPPGEPTEDQLDRARFYITLSEPMSMSELVMAGWRVDDVAALAVAAAMIVSHQGKVPRKAAEQVLRDKFPKWKVEYNLNRFIRRGYMGQDENGLLYLNWRARAELDQKTLLRLVLGEAVGDDAPATDPEGADPQGEVDDGVDTS